MGALAPVTPWIPQDDILLKNAVEAGASLESLAKGAIQFSRRFSIRELQDRWHSLLYDPIISAEASARMMEFERSASSLPSKSSKADHSKENKYVQVKRKAESVRRSYYARRKRICNEPLPGDIGFLVQPGDFIGGGEAPGPNCMLGHPMENPFGLEDANFGDHHVFPQDVHHNDEFPIVQQDTLEDPIDQNNLNKEIPHNSSTLVQMDPSKELAGHAIFEVDIIEPYPACNNSKDIMCSGFEGNTIFNTSVSDCGTSYHNLQYTSPPPVMPDWKHIDGIPVPEMPAGESMRGNNVHNEDPFGIRADGRPNKGTSDYDVIPPETQFNDEMSCDDLKHSTGCAEGFLADLSDTLFSFTSDKEILSIDGEKDVIDKSFYDDLSLLLNSPDDPVAHNVPNMPEKQEHNSGDSPIGDISAECNSATQVSASSSTGIPQFPEFQDGVICCTLNTEDPDIPSNDDIVFPGKPKSASAHKRTQNEANNPALPCMDITGNQTGDKGASQREIKRFGESHLPSQTRDQEAGLNTKIDEFGVQFETSKGESLNGLKSNGTSYGGSCPSIMAVKEEPLDPPLVKQPGCVADKSGHALGLRAGVGGINQDGQSPLATRNHEIYATGSADPMAIEPGEESLLSDPEEQFSESDSDIPYFSDIESMILEMDLGPDDQDSFSCSKVAKYQTEDAKRTIIRLEQNGHSYMKRAIASHGAFAVLYGRHSKHYIKKAEVLLGRGTDDVVVDIDLGKEGRANKISRRQAIIKLDNDGNFNLKNLGKCSIYINNKEIFQGQCFVLHSNCVVEIRGMPFIFEINQASVKKYMDNVVRKLKARAPNG